MKLAKHLMTTTHVDLHGERMDLAMLQEGVRQIERVYIPMTVDHDIRIPPIGRVTTAEVIKLPDGEYGLQATGEIFEESDSNGALVGDGRRIPTMCRQTHGIACTYDRTFNTEAGRDLVAELKQLSPPEEEPQLFLKKALEPISTLIISAGMFALGKVAEGFLSKLGSDVYDKLKAALLRYLVREKPEERILDFCPFVNTHHGPMEVHVLLVNPTEGMVARFLADGLSKLDGALAEVPFEETDVARVVFQYEADRLRFMYFVRGDAVPRTSRYPRNRCPRHEG